MTRMRVHAGQLVYPRIYADLAPEQRRIVDDVIAVALCLPGLKGLFWGGSTTLSLTETCWGDVDLWCVVSRVPPVLGHLEAALPKVTAVSFVHKVGYLPWFGNLFSCFFAPEYAFSVDVGVCTVARLGQMNMGPSPTLIWGDERLRGLLRHQRYPVAFDRRMRVLLVNLLKVRKSLSRDELWNAVEYLGRAREELMGLYDTDTSEERIFYSRPARGIERRLSASALERLASTWPLFAKESIAEAARRTLQLAVLVAKQEAPGTGMADELQRVLSIGL